MGLHNWNRVVGYITVAIVLRGMLEYTVIYRLTERL